MTPASSVLVLSTRVTSVVAPVSYTHLFIGLANYASVLSSSQWWDSVLSTVIITVFSVIIELVLGFTLAWVMHRAIFGLSLIHI